ncbi:MAG: hypothetical protein IKC77_07125 [Lentisphaeria bacterium]|nr:hypothetical protein [Lentisphaeria bacterium]
MTTDELNKQYDNLLRKEGYIKGMFAIANMIEKFLPKLQKLNGKQCCTVLLESIREQAKERKKECEKERSEIQNIATQELISEWEDKEE